ncbi:MAG TPA: ParB/RepB/Spo0J family partition protein [Candidatus Ornithocaccomicrobium faecavium]|uniref:ParB/RepB/Spo0J family partition protein n=1 Tax=Candidatus Ornithocaccomicrobium faecavium TaxID=2840890 RepID=A0A9D1P6M6_9FIRM|nr:ParB/RepB/Spo0J family partition protein [Clostridiales bacterium]HIV27541.1 ParB/RepB/Spo0J family partition protein [Candidatus Ornithocaccomicrobium faecavium]
MSTGKRGLGRGLDALLGTDAPEEQIAGHIDAVMQLPITKIDVNPGQPRRTFDEKALMELAESIRSVGVIQPIVVAQRAGRYTIIAGERRYRAARLAGLKEMPAIVRDWDEAVRLEAALIENLQREDLNPIEEALGVKNLMEQCGYTQERAAERLGKSRPAVANLLRLLTLDERVIEMVRAGQLSAGHARALVTVSKERQVKLAELTVQQGFSVRQLERICAQPEPEKKDAPAEKPVRAGELNDLERMAREIFGTRAKIEGDEDKGRLILNYYSQDDLQRIWEILEFMRQGGA